MSTANQSQHGVVQMPHIQLVFLLEMILDDGGTQNLPGIAGLAHSEVKCDEIQPDVLDCVNTSNPANTMGSRFYLGCFCAQINFTADSRRDKTACLHVFRDLVGMTANPS